MATRILSYQAHTVVSRGKTILGDSAAHDPVTQRTTFVSDTCSLVPAPSLNQCLTLSSLYMHRDKSPWAVPKGHSRRCCSCRCPHGPHRRHYCIKQFPCQCMFWRISAPATIPKDARSTNRLYNYIAAIHLPASRSAHRRRTDGCGTVCRETCFRADQRH